MHGIRKALAHCAFIVAAAVLCAPGGILAARQQAYDENALFERLDRDEQLYLLGLQYLMNCFQLKQYLTLPERGERDAWIEAFWLQLDPPPTTPENERRIEHEARVAEARRLFAAKGEPGWDRRGEMHIRFGEPDTRTIIDPDVTRYGASPPREEWYYGTFDMLLSFADITHNGEYYYNEEIPFSIATMLREAQQDAPQSRRGKVVIWPIFAKAPLEFMPLLEPKLESPKEGLSEKIDFCHAADIEIERLSACVEVASFRGGAGALRADVNVELPAEELILDGGRGVEPSEIDLRVLVRDARMDSVAFSADCIMAGSPEIRGRPYSDLVPGQMHVTLRPGYYRFGVEVIDRTTGRRSSYRSNLKLSAFEGGLAISDIFFAGRIRECEEGGKFVRGRFEVVPHPSHAYRRPRPAILYFEIYGLSTDGEGLAFYRIDYTVKPLGKRRWGPVLVETKSEVSSSFETSGFGSTQPMRLTIDTGELWEGTYDLLVTVKDRRTLATAQRRGRFSVLE